MRPLAGRIGGMVILTGCALLLPVIPTGAVGPSWGDATPFRDTGILLLNAGLVAIGGGAAVLALAGPGGSVRLGLGMLAVGLVSLVVSGIIPIPEGSNNLTSRPYLLTAGVGVAGLLGGALVAGVALVRSPGPSRIAGAVVLAGFLLVVLYPFLGGGVELAVIGIFSAMLALGLLAVRSDLSVPEPRPTDDPADRGVA